MLPNLARNSVDRFQASFKRRHDHLSAIRQRRIASIVIWTNIALAIVIAVSVSAWRWHPDISRSGWAWTISLWATSLVLIGLCSGIPLSIHDYLTGVSGRPVDPEDLELDNWAEIRKYIFYPGTCINLAVVAVLIEQTGGLLYSPFSSVLLAMILAAQQLGRYRLNSALYVAVGVCLIVGMLIWESISPVPAPTDVPRGLLFFIIVTSFSTAAIFSHLSKSPNFRIDKVDTNPMLVEVYVDAKGTWRYVLYSRSGRLDSAVRTIGADHKAPIGKIIEEVEISLRASQQWEDRSKRQIEWHIEKDGLEALGRIEAGIDGK